MVNTVKKLISHPCHLKFVLVWNENCLPYNNKAETKHWITQNKLSITNIVFRIIYYKIR